MIKAEDLYSLEKYDRIRPEFRKQVLAVKSTRQIQLGENLRILFENRLTIQYQIQEILRIEKIFKSQEVQEELDVYAPLISDHQNLKATMMLEYPDVKERQQKLKSLVNIEKKVYMQAGSLPKIYPIANEDLERQTEYKTSAVHFIRFPLGAEIHAALADNEELKFGVEHEMYRFDITVDENIRKSIIKDIS